MKEKLILTDADGVLLNWRQGFLDWLPDHIVNTACPIKLKQYDFSDAFDLDADAVQQLAHDFNESPDIVRLRPWVDALEYVKLLGEQGFRFRVFSAMGDKPISQVLRRQNLQILFGDLFDEVTCIPVGESKYSLLSKYEGSGLFWLEDHVSHAGDGHDLGLQSILVSDITNLHYTDIPFKRVSVSSPWKEIYKIVMQDYNS